MITENYDFPSLSGIYILRKPHTLKLTFGRVYADEADTNTHYFYFIDSPDKKYYFNKLINFDNYFWIGPIQMSSEFYDLIELNDICPLCKNRPIKVEKICNFENTFYQCKCDKCLLSASKSTDKKTAIEYWNNLCDKLKE